MRHNQDTPEQLCTWLLSEIGSHTEKADTRCTETGVVITIRRDDPKPTADRPMLVLCKSILAEVLEWAEAHQLTLDVSVTPEANIVFSFSRD